jgi:lipopolysaccharide export system permease protein
MTRIVRRIDVYILNEFLMSFVVAFLFFFFIFFVNQILVLAEEIFSKKVPFWDVVLFIVYSLPSILALAFPFGALVGSLMAVGRFSSDNEILAFRACGVSLRRILMPLLLAGALLSLVSFVINDYFLPLGNIRLGSMYRKILYANPGIELEPFSVKKYQDTVIVTGQIQGTTLHDIAIIDRDADRQKRVIVASAGVLEESRAQKGVISIRLDGVFSHVPDAQDPSRYEYTQAESMIYNILLKDLSSSFVNPGPREMSSVDVYREIRRMEANQSTAAAERQRAVARALLDLAMEVLSLRESAPEQPQPPESRRQTLQGLHEAYRRALQRQVVDRNLQLHRLEFHKKFAIPFGCLVFVLFAFPVGLLARRSGRAVGFGVGLLTTSLYWWLLFLGHSLGIRLEIAPALAMWFPNLLIFAAGVGLLALRGRR